MNNTPDGGPPEEIAPAESGMKLFKNVKEYIHSHPIIKKTVGIVLILVGFVALVTPLTPGSWLMLIGLELLGFRLLLFDKWNFFRRK